MTMVRDRKHGVPRPNTKKNMKKSSDDTPLSSSSSWETIDVEMQDADRQQEGPDDDGSQNGQPESDDEQEDEVAEDSPNHSDPTQQANQFKAICMSWNISKLEQIIKKMSWLKGNPTRVPGTYNIAWDGATIEAAYKLSEETKGKRDYVRWRLFKRWQDREKGHLGKKEKVGKTWPLKQMYFRRDLKWLKGIMEDAPKLGDGFVDENPDAEGEDPPSKKKELVKPPRKKPEKGKPVSSGGQKAITGSKTRERDRREENSVGGQSVESTEVTGEPVLENENLMDNANNNIPPNTSPVHTQPPTTPTSNASPAVDTVRPGATSTSTQPPHPSHSTKSPAAPPSTPRRPTKTAPGPRHSSLIREDLLLLEVDVTIAEEEANGRRGLLYRTAGADLTRTHRDINQADARAERARGAFAQGRMDLLRAQCEEEGYDVPDEDE